MCLGACLAYNGYSDCTTWEVVEREQARKEQKREAKFERGGEGARKADTVSYEYCKSSSHKR